MEIEYKLSAIIDSCINESQLVTARICYLKAAESKKITQEQYIFLKKSADHKEKFLKDQMAQFELERLSVELHTDMSEVVDIMETTALKPAIRIYEPKTVEEAAEGITSRKVA